MSARPLPGAFVGARTGLLMTGPWRIALALAALSLSACASNPNGGLQEASTTGSVATATTGPANPANSPPPVAAGGVLSGAIGATLDERDRQRAYAAEVQALEHGEPGLPTGWRGESATRHGTVVPGAAYDARGTRCRDYTHTIYIDGRPQTARATACRNPDGSWGPVG